ncbi:conserved Plasmodium protein, unknown function [Plasmodium gallinaceum]|uniref:Uncharacterized protein n=1 Tax=Plasmodium gallinaceum TaxID=5849 RepID=A0A1J1GQJ2_PLAGA|nr:conserved Plasmodium protein, unknown function [Plasmodium gallinaceum]CRG94723.1 conserved Plasmodium protein, unknown function [Plasmodium gallinaceum]
MNSETKMDNTNMINKLNKEKHEEIIECLKNKDLGKNVFETLENFFLEEKENNKNNYKELYHLINKIKTDFDDKINSLKDNTHENFEELKYYMDELNKNNKENTLDSNSFKDDIDFIKDDLLNLKKQKDENINLIKSSTRTYFDKIKSMLNIMNINIENVKEEITKYKENNEIENKKKYIEILQLINDENEILNKRREESVNYINEEIKQVKEYINGFKESLEKHIKNIEYKIEINKKEIDEKINTISKNQKKFLEDFYPSYKN